MSSSLNRLFTPPPLVDILILQRAGRAAAVAQLRACGAVLARKTNMHKLSAGTSGRRGEERRGEKVRDSGWLRIRMRRWESWREDKYKIFELLRGKKKDGGYFPSYTVLLRGPHGEMHYPCERVKTLARDNAFSRAGAGLAPVARFFKVVPLTVRLESTGAGVQESLLCATVSGWSKISDLNLYSLFFCVP